MCNKDISISDSLPVFINPKINDKYLINNFRHQPLGLILNRLFGVRGHYWMIDLFCYSGVVAHTEGLCVYSVRAVCSPPLQEPAGPFLELQDLWFSCFTVGGIRQCLESKNSNNTLYSTSPQRRKYSAANCIEK